MSIRSVAETGRAVTRGQCLTNEKTTCESDVGSTIEKCGDIIEKDNAFHSEATATPGELHSADGLFWHTETSL